MPIPLQPHPQNVFKEALLNRRPQIGLWSSLPNNLVVEVLATAGFDWILLDTEHSPNEPINVLSELQAMVGGSATPVVRIASNDPTQVKQMIDLGVQTFLIPMVQNAEEARAAVSATRFPSQDGGVRGYTGLSRANKFGRVQDYHQQAHQQICVLVQIETVAAMKEIDAIAAVDGVDGLFIGPGDLSSDMGYLGSPSHPAVLEAIAEGLKRIIASGRAAGILAGVEAEARQWLALGATFVAVGSDLGILARGAESLVQKFKALQAGEPPSG